VKRHGLTVKVATVETVRADSRVTLRLLAEKGLLAEPTAAAPRRFDQAAVDQAAAE